MHNYLTGEHFASALVYTKRLGIIVWDDWFFVSLYIQIYRQDNVVQNYTKSCKKILNKKHTWKSSFVPLQVCNFVNQPTIFCFNPRLAMEAIIPSAELSFHLFCRKEHYRLSLSFLFCRFS